MQHLDITIDIETCGRSAQAAPMQVAAVAWNRDGEETPFIESRVTEATDYTFNAYIDLRTCVVDGFEFEPDTVQWWSRQSENAKQAVCDGLAEPVEEVFLRLLHWVEAVKQQMEATTLCLWAQGSDFDIAILRSICRRYDIALEDSIGHTQLRDSRTLLREAALVRARRLYRQAIAAAETLLPDGTPIPTPDILAADVLRGSSRAYDLYTAMPDDLVPSGTIHDARYDALRTTWNTWQALRWINA